MSRKTNVLVVALTVLGVLLALVPEADAQRRARRGRAIDGVRIDVHLDLGWYEAFGAGMRVDIPLVPDGFIASMHDELALTVGGDFFFWAWGAKYRGNHGYWDYHQGDGVAFLGLAAAQWNFYLNEHWSLFPELGFGMVFWSHSHDRDRDSHGHVRPTPVGGFGARWHFSDRNALLFRAHWPAGFQFGITF